MITTYHSLAFHHQMKPMPWTAEELFDFDLPESTDEHSSVDSVLAEDDRDRVLNHLRHLTISSLSSYQEIASIARGCHLKSFAEVIVRQRSAQQQSLADLMGYLAATEEDDDAESLAALRSLWRGAIWNLEEGHHGLFLEYAERAEALLEESYLLAAQTLAADPVAPEIRNYAVMICGARAIIEELLDSASRQPRPQHASDKRCQPEESKATVASGSRYLGRSVELDPKRSTMPERRRDGDHGWGRGHALRATTLKPNRSGSRAPKVERR